jgi:hypothetical protein
MISFDCTRTTTHQDHKQKPVFSMESSITANAVNVEIASLESVFRQSDLQYFTLISNGDKPLNYQASLNAGLQSKEGYSYNSHYKEN